MTEAIASPLNLDVLPEGLEPQIAPLLNQVLALPGGVIEGIYLYGSACTDDYDVERSNVNTLFLLHGETLLFVQALAVLGAKHAGPQVAAPVILTRSDITNSLDAFPMEFLDWKTNHQVIYFDGEEGGYLSRLEIPRADLRLQCERALRTRLFGLRETYVASGGTDQNLLSLFGQSITSYFPIFKGMLQLAGQEIPVLRDQTLQAVSDHFQVNIAPLREALDIRCGLAQPVGEGLRDLFETFYGTLEDLVAKVDGIEV